MPPRGDSTGPWGRHTPSYRRRPPALQSAVNVNVYSEPETDDAMPDAREIAPQPPVEIETKALQGQENEAGKSDDDGGGAEAQPGHQLVCSQSAAMISALIVLQ